MITALLLAAAAAAIFASPGTLSAAKEYIAAIRERASGRQLVAVALLVAAALSWSAGRTPEAPAPQPPAPAGFTLAGLFRGPTASADAATIGALCLELADEIEHDGKAADPVLKTGVAFDDLRSRSRDLRCRGISIGSRQTAARDAIASRLEQAVGISGGPVTPEQRAKWVSAFREIGEAATDASR
jgi:hypothetical protein